MHALAIVLTADYSIWGGPTLVVATVVLLLLGIGFDRERLGNFGAAIGLLLWFVVVTAAMTLCLYAMGEAGRAGGWRLPVLVAALLPFVTAGEWSLRHLRAD